MPISSAARYEPPPERCAPGVATCHAAAAEACAFPPNAARDMADSDPIGERAHPGTAAHASNSSIDSDPIGRQAYSGRELIEAMIVTSFCHRDGHARPDTRRAMPRMRRPEIGRTVAV